jgi:murein DD-endopeptidase MepM/ murein hydrolase activator NlpD
MDCSVFPAQDSALYVLPYTVGSAFEVWGSTSHYNEGNRGVGLYAIDFVMPIGTPVVAARSGVVVAARDSFPDGNGEDLEENFVFVRHADATIGRYFHLTRDGADVDVGDSVAQGQPIGRSGNSGQSTGPHLHFDVQRCGPNLPPAYNRLPCGQTVPVVFRNTDVHRCGVLQGHKYPAR